MGPEKSQLLCIHFSPTALHFLDLSFYDEFPQGPSYSVDLPSQSLCMWYSTVTWNIFPNCTPRLSHRLSRITLSSTAVSFETGTSGEVLLADLMRPVFPVSFSVQLNLYSLFIAQCLSPLYNEKAMKLETISFLCSSLC